MNVRAGISALISAGKRVRKGAGEVSRDVFKSWATGFLFTLSAIGLYELAVKLVGCAK